MGLCGLLNGYACLLSARGLATLGSDMCRPVADACIPAQGIKLVFGREEKKGKGVFTAVFQELEKLRKGILIERIRIDEPLPDRRPASMQVWVLHPDKDRKLKVLSTPMLPAACIKCMHRSHSEGLLCLGLFGWSFSALLCINMLCLLPVITYDVGEAYLCLLIAHLPIAPCL